MEDLFRRGRNRGRHAHRHVDLKQGLPSPAGKNSLVLNDVTVSLAAYGDPASVAPHEEMALSAAWHSAVRR